MSRNYLNDEEKATDETNVVDIAAKETVVDETAAEDTHAEGVKDVVISAAEIEEANEDIVELSTKYRYDGQVIDKIDMSALNDMSYAKEKQIQKLYKKIRDGYSSTPEMTDEYAIAAASVLTDLPIEFYQNINAKDIKRIRNRVINFFYSE